MNPQKMLRILNGLGKPKEVIISRCNKIPKGSCSLELNRKDRKKVTVGDSKLSLNLPGGYKDALLETLSKLAVVSSILGGTSLLGQLAYAAGTKGPEAAAQIITDSIFFAEDQLIAETAERIKEIQEGLDPSAGLKKGGTRSGGLSVRDDNNGDAGKRDDKPSNGGSGKGKGVNGKGKGGNGKEKDGNGGEGKGGNGKGKDDNGGNGKGSNGNGKNGGLNGDGDLIDPFPIDLPF